MDGDFGVDGKFGGNYRERERYKASTHFVWRQEPADILGEGSFGTVYRGLHKETCEPVAVKTFNRNTYSRPLTTQFRELTIQQRLNHPNVVNLIAIEDEIVSNRTPAQLSNNLQGKVLIMEYCTEGSLYSIIEHPENHFGLDETELIRFLAHITAGMKYLQENKIIHRDWKPSNILKTINDDGTVLYKLCDFGAARELESNQPFASIVGTEEYLHPEIFRRALLGGTMQYFYATSELWSVGVTLYHVATGQLPFRPFGGRKNREMMHKITYGKENGVISGVQETENGPIQYSKELPKHCRLSNSFRRFLTKLLASLLEPQATSGMTFERFFADVDQFLAKVCVRCCTSTNFATQNLYVDRSCDFKQFLTETCDDLTIKVAEDIVIFQDGRMLTRDSVFDLMKVSEKSRKSPVFIAVPTQNIDPHEDLRFPKLPVFSDQSSIEKDVETAKACCALSFWAVRVTNEQTAWKEICDKSAIALIDILNEKLKNLKSVWKQDKHHWRWVAGYLKNMSKFITSEEGKKHISAKMKSAESLENDISFQESSMLNVATDLRNLDCAALKQQISNSFFALDRTGGSILEIFAQFRNDKVLSHHVRDPRTYNEIKWHDLLKKQLKKNWESVEGHINKNVGGSNVDMYQQFFENAFKVYRTISLAEQRLTLLKQMITTFEKTLKQVFDEHLGENASQPQNGSLTSLSTATKSENGVNLYSMPEFTNHFMQIVKDAQELRRVVVKNHEQCKKMFE